jgi:very-short-patch-repair endonuclease
VNDAYRRCLELAASQFGALSRRQAEACGLTASAIDRRLTAGEFIVARRATFVTIGSSHSWERDLWVAHLWAGETSAISHRAAGALWGFEGIPRGVVELTTTRALEGDGVIVHRKKLNERDARIKDGLRLTAPSRTLLDLADVTHRARFERCLHDALHRGSTSIPELHSLLARAGGQGVRGCTLLRTAIAETVEIDVRSQTTFERRLGRLIRESHLPKPVPQFEIFDDFGFVARPDFAYPAERLAIEADSYRWHADKQAWAEDLRRRTRLARAGWRVLHFTWHDVYYRPDFVIDQIRRALQQ